MDVNPPPSMRQRMLAGELYLAGDAEIAAEETRALALSERYNAIPMADRPARRALLEELLGGIGEDTVIRSPVWFDRGYQTTFGARCFVNFGAMILDVGRVTIGDDVQMGANVQLLTPMHPLDAEVRRTGLEYAEPITIGDGVWLAAGVMVCAGVTIGARSVIGAGSVVLRDVPPDVLAAGNPCRVIRSLVPGDEAGHQGGSTS